MKRGNLHLYLANNLLKIPKSNRSTRVFNLLFNNLPNSKRSQLSIFIVIAIIFLVIFILGYVVYKTNIINLESKKVNPEISFVYEEINKCINQRVIDALGLIGLQGGYVILPPNYIKTEIANVAYGLSNKKNVLISLEDIENQIENYLGLTVSYCNPVSEELEILSEKPEAKVTIDENVKVSVNFPLSIKKGDNSFHLKTPYEYVFDIRLKKIHETANKIIEKQLENPDYLDLTFLSSIETHTTFIRVDDNTGLFVITDEESLLDDIEYSFMFGVKLG